MTKAESKVALVIGISLLFIPGIVVLLFAPGKEGGLLALMVIVFIAPLGLILTIVAGVQLFLLRYKTRIAAAREGILDYVGFKSILMKEPKEDRALPQLDDERVNGPKEDPRVPHLLDDESVWVRVIRGDYSVEGSCLWRIVGSVLAIVIVAWLTGRC